MVSCWRIASFPPPAVGVPVGVPAVGAVKMGGAPGGGTSPWAVAVVGNG